MPQKTKMRLQLLHFHYPQHPLGQMPAARTPPRPLHQSLHRQQWYWQWAGADGRSPPRLMQEAALLPQRHSATCRSIAPHPLKKTPWRQQLRDQLRLLT